MTEFSADSPVQPLGDDLPPVQPPSAGFIVQLFVVPGLIVLAVVAVWALFGRIAATDQDWRRLVQDLDSANPHVHKRAMFGLAQLLDTDLRLMDRGQHLSANSEIATALAAQFDKTLQSDNHDEDSLSMQVYLSRALGLLDVPDATVPVLAKALDGLVDVEVRKGAVTSLALIAGRALERGQPLGGDAVEALVGLSLDSDPALRRAAAFALGLTPSSDADARLNVMLGDADHMTSVNAAIALARQHSKSGLAVFAKALSATPPANDPAAIQDTLLIQKNVLKAVADLGSDLDAQEQSQMRQLIQPLADHHAEPRIRVDAQRALASLTAPVR
jgi:hypothetical protein